MKPTPVAFDLSRFGGLVPPARTAGPSDPPPEVVFSTPPVRSGPSGPSGPSDFSIQEKKGNEKGKQEGECAEKGKCDFARTTRTGSEDGRRVWPIREGDRLARWRLADEHGLRVCHDCGGPFIWARVVSDTDPKAKQPTWIKLDPDGMPHGPNGRCGGTRANRFILTDPQHEGLN